MNTDPKPKRTTIPWIALAVLNCVVLVPLLGRIWLPPHDFGMFYTAVQIYLHGNPAHLYDFQLQQQTQQMLYNIPTEQLSTRFLPYNHLPYELVLWLPMARLSPAHAFWLWAVENAALLIFSIWLFAKVFPMQRSTPALLLIALAFFPIPYCFLTGQDTFVTLALITISLRLLKDERNILAGAALGLGLFKFQLVLPIVGIFFLLQSWRVVAGFVSSSAAVVAISWLMVGREGMAGLFHMWVKGETGGVVCINPLTMPNVRGLLSCIPGLPSSVVLVTTLILSALLLLLAAHQAKAAPTAAHVFAIALCFVILVSFHTNMYDLAILTLPILLLLEIAPGWKPPPWPVRILIWLVFFGPLYVAAISDVRVALLAVLAGWMWGALVVAIKLHESEPVAQIVRPVPRLATATRN